MGQALYRKYRSRSLEELVGQEHVTDTLARAVKAGSISHAYLFTGPRGTGKTSVARILAHQINDLPYSDKTHLDIIEIDAASNRRIDDIRDLRDKVFIAPVSAKYKVYIIDEVHMLTGESFNALLKTLEEPPAHVVFILATTEVHKLPATIISRTQRYAFRLGSVPTLTAHLKSIAEKENINIEDEALQIVAEHGEGSFRDSLSLLDQISHISDGKITAQNVADTLGLAPQDQITALTDALVAADAAAIVTALQKVDAQSTNTLAIVDQLTKHLLVVAPEHPRLFSVIDTLLDVPRSYNPKLKLFSALAVQGSAAQAMPKKPDEPKTSPLLATTHSVTVAEAAPVKSSNPETPAKKAIKTEPLQNLDPADWAKVLAATKQKSPPIYAVLKQAQPILADGALVLTFKYGLHSKKLDDIKQKALVVAVIQETLGSAPEVKVAVSKDAVAPVIADDPRVSSVTEIMGGGEVIDAKI